MENKHVKLALLGFGNVLRAFAVLLSDKTITLEERYGITMSIVGVATRSHGIAINPDGLDLVKAVESKHVGELHVGDPVRDAFQFVRECPADIVLEATVVNPKTGQPALDLVRLALESGKHVVTANKGPVAYGLRELRTLAEKNNLGFFFESTVMDGTPLHSVAREGLLAAEITGIRGVLNSTTNAILTRMEEGESFRSALREMQEAGIAETDPSNDIDGWDSAIKITILANTLMGGDIRPTDVQRTGIRDITPEDVRTAVEDGYSLKLVCQAFRNEQGIISASVAPMELPPEDPLAWLDDTASGITLETDVIDSITIIESPASPYTTAYGMLVDTLNIIRGRR
jgi:homoserine dehydrogenase